MGMKNDAVILFSGGIDSTTALYWALKKFDSVLPLVIDYSQKHNVEVTNAIKICKNLDLVYKIVELPLKNILGSALMDDDIEIPHSLKDAKDDKGIPFTYVPFRNGLFLSLAAGVAETEGIKNIVTGFNLIDTPDYPDTTEDFVKKMEAAINEGTGASITGQKFKIVTPLIEMSKREIIELGLKIGADYSFSVSCYRGEEQPCLECPSCEIRMLAFKDIGMEDPLIERLRMEKRNET